MAINQQATGNAMGRQREPANLSRGQRELRQYYSTLLSRLQQARDGLRPLTIGFTSTAAGEGVSTVVANLARRAATLGEAVLLVDTNIFRPRLHRDFRVKLAPGASEALVDGMAAAECIQPTRIGGLSIVAAGAKRRARHSTSDASIVQFIQATQLHHSLVLFDLPPVGERSAAFTLAFAAQLQGVVIVVEAERLAGTVVQNAKHSLEFAAANPLGVVFNRRRNQQPSWMPRGDAPGA